MKYLSEEFLLSVSVYFLTFGWRRAHWMAPASCYSWCFCCCRSNTYRLFLLWGLHLVIFMMLCTHATVARQVVGRVSIHLCAHWHVVICVAEGYKGCGLRVVRLYQHVGELLLLFCLPASSLIVSGWRTDMKFASSRSLPIYSIQFVTQRAKQIAFGSYSHDFYLFATTNITTFCWWSGILYTLTRGYHSATHTSQSAMRSFSLCHKAPRYNIPSLFSHLV